MACMSQLESQRRDSTASRVVMMQQTGLFARKHASHEVLSLLHAAIGCFVPLTN